MANQLKMALIETLLRLHAQGWSQRRIARELGLDRAAVARHIREAAESPDDIPGGTIRAEPKPAKAPTGSADIPADSKPASAPPGSSLNDAPSGAEKAAPAT